MTISYNINKNFSLYINRVSENKKVSVRKDTNYFEDESQLSALSNLDAAIDILNIFKGKPNKKLAVGLRGTKMSFQTNIDVIDWILGRKLRMRS